MGGFEFWKRWLVVVGCVLTVFGLLLAFFNQTSMFNLLFNDRVNPAFWPTGAVPSEAKIFQQWIYGVLGTVLAGWAIFMVFLVHHGFPLRQLWVWRCFALGIGMWFVVDSALLFYFEVAFNVLSNLLILVALGVPLAATKKHFT